MLPSIIGIRGLGKLVANATSSQPSRASVDELVRLCWRMSEAYLRVQAARGHLDCRFFGLSIDDLAQDCIADLFQRDTAGIFIQLASYACREELTETTPDADALSAMRRLVSSKTHDQLCRLYQLHDPMLSKLVRNLKNAARSSGMWCLDGSNGEVWVNPYSKSGHDASLPWMPPEIMELHLGQILPAGSNVKTILAACADVLRDQEEYRKGFRVVGLALLIRSLMLAGMCPKGDSPAVGDRLAPGELQALLRASIERTRKRTAPYYVGGGRIDRTVYDCYLAITETILSAQFIAENGERMSLFSLLKSAHPGLTLEEYRSNHRVTIEHLLKIAREDFLKNVKTEVSEGD